MTDEPESNVPTGTPEGHTKEAPTPSELGEPGTPGAAAEHHDPQTHMDAHAVLSDDDHGHAEAALGPIDWSAWAYALVGGAAGLLVLLVFWVAVS
jgi:hypothetical protein